LGDGAKGEHLRNKADSISFVPVLGMRAETLSPEPSEQRGGKRKTGHAPGGEYRHQRENML
jgi:hypothetical protein